MSRNLLRSANFIKLLLEKNQSLNRQLLSHASDKNLKAIAEIFYNVFRLPLGKKKKELFLQRLKFLKKFVKFEERRKKLARLHHRVIGDLLFNLRKYLNKILI